MKKCRVVLWVVVLALVGLTAAVSAQETLVVAARGGSHVDAMNAVKDAFEAEHDVKIEILGLESADLKQKIGLDSVNEVGELDLIMVDDPWMPEFGENGILANLSELGYEADADFAEKSLALGRVPYATGDIYALPYSGNVILFFYNKALFEKYDVTEVPGDWAAVLEIAKKVSEGGEIGYVIRGTQGDPIVADFLPVLWAFGGNVFDEDFNVTIDSEEAKAALTLYMALLENGVNYEKNDIVAAVSEGKAAMSLGWPSWYISGETASAAYAPIPGKVDGGAEKNAAGMIGNWLMGVTANSGKKELALEFLKYVTSAEAQKTEALHGGVPTRASVLTDAGLTAKYAYFPTLLEATNESVARPRTPLWGEVQTALGAELSAAISGVKSVEDALTTARMQIEMIME